MYNSIIVENLMNPKVQSLHKEWTTIRLLNQANPPRAGMLRKTRRQIPKISKKKLSWISLIKLNLSWKRNQGYRRG